MVLLVAMACPAQGKQAGRVPRLAEARVRLAAIETEVARLTKQYETLVQARDAAARRLSSLLGALWPMRAGALAGTPLLGGDWAETDRRYVWTRSVFEAVWEARAAYEAASVKAHEGLLARDAARVRLLSGRKEADAAFSEVVSNRVMELQGQPEAGGHEGPKLLDQALDGTNNGEEGANGQEPAKFTPPAGGLSWPAVGRVAAGFAPSGQPPRQGIVLAVPEGTPVAAAADGRVVFTGTLRGLGRVVIVSHDARCHTVYACLGQSEASVGDGVARDAPIGWSGFCGPTKAPGVYFELRFREKALNPAEWLAARR